MHALFEACVHVRVALVENEESCIPSVLFHLTANDDKYNTKMILSGQGEESKGSPQLYDGKRIDTMSCCFPRPRMSFLNFALHY